MPQSACPRRSSRRSRGPRTSRDGEWCNRAGFRLPAPVDRRPSASAVLTPTHWQKNRVRRCSLEEFLARTDLEPLAQPGSLRCCAACYRDASVIKSMLCHAHNCRMLDARRADPGLDTGDWLATQTAISEGAGGELPRPVGPGRRATAVRASAALPGRRADSSTRLRALTSWLRAERVSSLDALSAGAGFRGRGGPADPRASDHHDRRRQAGLDDARVGVRQGPLGHGGARDDRLHRLRRDLTAVAEGDRQTLGPARRAAAPGRGAGNNLRSQGSVLPWTCALPEPAGARRPGERPGGPAWAGRTSSSSSPAGWPQGAPGREISTHKRRQGHPPSPAGSILASAAVFSG